MDYMKILQSPDLVLGMMDLLSDDDPSVVKRTIRVFTNMYCHILNQLKAGHLDQATFSAQWPSMSSVASHMLKMLPQAENEGITVHLVRFLEAAVMAHLHIDHYHCLDLDRATPQMITQGMEALTNLVTAPYVGGSAYLVAISALITVSCYKPDSWVSVTNLIQQQIQSPPPTLFDHNVRSLHKSLQRNLFRLLHRANTSCLRRQLVNMMVSVGASRRTLVQWDVPQEARKRPPQASEDEITGRGIPPEKRLCLDPSTASHIAKRSLMRVPQNKTSESRLAANPKNCVDPKLHSSRNPRLSHQTLPLNTAQEVLKPKSLPSDDQQQDNSLHVKFLQRVINSESAAGSPKFLSSCSEKERLLYDHLDHPHVVSLVLVCLDLAPDAPPEHILRYLCREGSISGVREHLTRLLAPHVQDTFISSIIPADSKFKASSPPTLKTKPTTTHTPKPKPTLTPKQPKPAPAPKAAPASLVEPAPAIKLEPTSIHTLELKPTPPHKSEPTSTPKYTPKFLPSQTLMPASDLTTTLSATPVSTCALSSTSASQPSPTFTSLSSRIPTFLSTSKAISLSTSTPINTATSGLSSAHIPSPTLTSSPLSTPASLSTAKPCSTPALLPTPLMLIPKSSLKPFAPPLAPCPASTIATSSLQDVDYRRVDVGLRHSDVDLRYLPNSRFNLKRDVDMRTSQLQKNPQPLSNPQRNPKPFIKSQQNLQPLNNPQQNPQPLINSQQNLQPIHNTQQNPLPLLKLQQNPQPSNNFEQSEVCLDNPQQNPHPLGTSQLNSEALGNPQLNSEPHSNLQQNPLPLSNLQQTPVPHSNTQLNPEPLNHVQQKFQLLQNSQPLHTLTQATLNQSLSYSPKNNAGYWKPLIGSWKVEAGSETKGKPVNEGKNPSNENIDPRKEQTEPKQVCVKPKKKNKKPKKKCMKSKKKCMKSKKYIKPKKKKNMKGKKAQINRKKKQKNRSGKVNQSGNQMNHKQVNTSTQLDPRIVRMRPQMQLPSNMQANISDHRIMQPFTHTKSQGAQMIMNNGNERFSISFCQGRNQNLSQRANDCNKMGIMEFNHNFSGGFKGNENRRSTCHVWQDCSQGKNTSGSVNTRFTENYIAENFMGKPNLVHQDQYSTNNWQPQKLKEIFTNRLGTWRAPPSGRLSQGTAKNVNSRNSFRFSSLAMGPVLGSQICH